MSESFCFVKTVLHTIQKIKIAYITKTIVAHTVRDRGIISQIMMQYSINGTTELRKTDRIMEAEALKHRIFINPFIIQP